MSTTAHAAGERLEYPATREADVQEVLHGVNVRDPYRWLEDPDSEETRAWVDAENAVTRKYLERFGGTREKARARLEQLQNYERIGCPMRRGDKYAFVFRNSGLQNQDVLYKMPLETITSPGTPADVLARATPFLDLNAQFPDGTTALGSSSFSEDGRKFAYGLARGGSDWQTLYVRDVESGDQLADEIPWTKFTRIAWTHDHKGFFYSRHPEPAAVGSERAGTETTATQYAMIWYHHVGTPAAEDVLVYANPDEPIWRFGAEVSDDGEYLLLATYKGTDPVNQLYYAHLPTVWATWLELARARRVEVPAGGVPPPASEYNYLPLVRFVNDFAAEYEYITNDGPRFYLKTNLHAPKYRMIAVDFPPTAAPNIPPTVSPPVVHDVVAETADVLDWATVVGRTYLLCCYLHDCVNEVKVTELPAVPPPLGADATLLASFSTVPLPGPGTISGFSGRREHDAAFIKYVSFLAPGTILKVSFAPPGGAAPEAPAPAAAGFSANIPHPFGADGGVADPSGLSAGRISVFTETRFAGFDPYAFEVTQEFVPSKDGKARIPLFVVKKRDAPGTTASPRPTLLYGYGGFNISLQPSFSALRLLWLNEFGGVYALACIRGGGEYGESWHEAGSKHNKQNCFDDFIACGQHLVARGVSAPRKVGIMGGSNGGLLVLACAIQQPALFGAVVSQVPVTDMLRFHKFTVGALWRGEYGFTEDSKDDFEYVMKYSPLHNVRAVASEAEELPSILITTADHDDRVVPLHSLKMTATLQAVAGACAAQRRPLLVRVETKAGHGAGKPTSKILDEYADVYSFLAHELGAEWHAA